MVIDVPDVSPAIRRNIKKFSKPIRQPEIQIVFPQNDLQSAVVVQRCIIYHSRLLILFQEL